jgi:hypothetical protein
VRLPRCSFREKWREAAPAELVHRRGLERASEAPTGKLRGSRTPDARGQRFGSNPWGGELSDSLTQIVPFQQRSGDLRGKSPRHHEIERPGRLPGTLG